MSSATLVSQFQVDVNILAACPGEGAELIAFLDTGNDTGKSHWGKNGELRVRLESGAVKSYFLKVLRNGDVGRLMCQGEFESLKAIAAATPGFCPTPYAWGQCTDGQAYFLITEFHEIGEQPAQPDPLAKGLADLHLRSVSPTGQFGFHMRTTHALIDQAVDVWDDSWCVVFHAHLSHAVDLARPILQWPAFDAIAALVLARVVPRLLRPLQENGRVIKPCLVHGDCWDGNTATDARTGQAFVFDACSFYAHNEYDVGNWRAPRHKLSGEAYVQSYKKYFPPSEPTEEWDARNLLYSLPFNIGNACFVPNSDQRPIIYKDMVTLCEMFCKDELDKIAFDS